MSNNRPRHLWSAKHGDDGHEKLPEDGQIAARWRT
jgi:hypothetical protein